MTLASPGRTPPTPALAFVAAALIAALVGLAFLASPVVALGLAVAVAALAAGLRFPDFATYVVLFLLYSNLPAVGVAFHGVPKLVAAAFPLLLVFPLARDLVLRRQEPVSTPVLWVLVVLLAVQVLGAAFSIDPGSSFAP